MEPMNSKTNSNDHTEKNGNESDIVSFWLLLLFIALFFGIAAEEARRPMFVSASQTPGANLHVTNPRLDLSSMDQNGNRASVGTRADKSEVPATGK